MAKIALLIGVSEYEPGLEGLPSAVNDATAMQQVLTNPEMGEFAAADVTVLQNPSRRAMETAIFNLFAKRAKEDLVLLYFSGHGVVDEGGEFYFASRDTCKDEGRLVPITAVEAKFVQHWMEKSRSQHKVIILDSCFSGAFAKGVKAKDCGSVNPERFLGGKGTAILTASTSTQYALALEGFDLSVYTHYLVEGIRTGGADLDNEGSISVEELHDYANSKVKEAAPAMTPEFYPVKEGYKILLAKSPKDDPQLKYRKAVKLLAEEDEGDFSFINRHYLDDLQRSLMVLPDDAATIEFEELEPYRQRRVKVDRYRTVFEGAISKRYPLTEGDRRGLQRLQQLLSLRDEDVTEIETITDPLPPPPSPLHSPPPKVTHKELDECDSSKLLYIKNVRRLDGDWAYTLKNIQEIGGLVESRVFELHWLPTGRGARLASKDDLMILNQQAKVTHVVEMLDDEVRKNESGYFRWVRVVWMPQEKDWYQLPHQREILGFEPPRIGGGTVYSFTSPNFGKFHAAWNNLQDFQQHVFQSLTGVGSPTLDKIDEDDLG
ncbi:MAG: caspase family protein [Phormidesmis sp. CAN_BIN44]|nr:caspase family protein [Phormidesmis sp. CAN_BIN44]